MLTDVEHPLSRPPVAEQLRRRRPLRWLAAYGPALVLVAAAIGLWELLVDALDVPEYLMAAPSAIARTFGKDGGLLADNTWVTVQEMLLGFLVALGAGIAFAILLHLSRTLRRAAYPILIVSQTVPIPVLAPILVILLGYDITPKLVVVALICFFPIVVNGVDGLRGVDPELIRMMRTLDASRLSIFRRIEFPSALPLLFSGMRIAATYAAIGAVFGEWAGSSAGLGFVMQQATPNLLTARVLAAVVILSALSLALFLAVSLIERAVAPWARRGGDAM